MLCLRGKQLTTKFVRVAQNEYNIEPELERSQKLEKHHNSGT